MFQMLLAQTFSSLSTCPLTLKLKASLHLLILCTAKYTGEVLKRMAFYHKLHSLHNNPPLSTENLYSSEFF